MAKLRGIRNGLVTLEEHSSFVTRDLCEYCAIPQVDYRNFLDGEPNDGLGNGEDCVNIVSATGKWQDLNCRIPGSGICKQRQKGTGL